MITAGWRAPLVGWRSRKRRDGSIVNRIQVWLAEMVHKTRLSMRLFGKEVAAKAQLRQRSEGQIFRASDAAKYLRRGDATVITEGGTTAMAE